MMSAGLSPYSGIITLDQNWHLRYSSSVGGKDLFIDTQIAVIGSVEPELFYFTLLYNNFICNNNQYKKAAIREELNPYVR